MGAARDADENSAKKPIAEAQRMRRKYLDIENTLKVSFSVISAFFVVKAFHLRFQARHQLSNVSKRNNQWYLNKP